MFLFSVSIIKTNKQTKNTKVNLGEENLEVSHWNKPDLLKAGTRYSRQVSSTEAGTTEECYLLSCSPRLAQPAFLHHPGPPALGYHSHSNQQSRNGHRHTFNLRKAFPWLKFPLPLGCFKFTKLNQHRPSSRLPMTTSALEVSWEGITHYVNTL